MPEDNGMTARDAKLIQYLNEAYGKERELEMSLGAHIQMTTRAPYKKRLQEHLRETKRHAKDVQRRIKQLGGTAQAIDMPGPDAVSDVANVVQGAAKRGVALAKGTAHAIRGTGEQEKMLKNAKTEFWNEHEEIATYRAIETLADAVGDKETVKLARSILREEQRMAKFLEKLIPSLTKAVVTEEIPAAERRANGTRRRSTSRSRSASSSRSSGGSARSKGSSRSGAATRSGSGSSSRSSGSRSSGSRSGSQSSGSRSGSRSSGSRSGSSSGRTSSRSSGSSARSGGSSRSGASARSGAGSRSSKSGSRSSGSSRKK